jgi:hypothetical protein
MLMAAGMSAATSARYVGTVAPPLVGPARTAFAATFDKLKLNAGVDVAVLTAVVNIGFRFPALKEVTVPVPPVEAHPVAFPFARMPVGA